MLFVDPPTYGRSAAGSRSTTTTHQPTAATTATAGATSTPSRRRSEPPAPPRARSARTPAGPGTPGGTWCGSARPDEDGGERRPTAGRRSRAPRTSAHAAPTSSSISSGVGVVVAEHQDGGRSERRDQRGQRRLAGPSCRRTIAYSRSNRADPASASGSRIATEDRPKRRTDRPIAHSGQRRLVDGDELAGVDSPEEQRRPALGGRLRRRRVVGIGVAADGQVPQVRDGCQRDDADGGRQDPPISAGSPGEQAAGGVLVDRDGAHGRTIGSLTVGTITRAREP